MTSADDEATIKPFGALLIIIYCMFYMRKSLLSIKTRTNQLLTNLRTAYTFRFRCYRNWHQENTFIFVTHSFNGLHTCIRIRVQLCLIIWQFACQQFVRCSNLPRIYWKGVVIWQPDHLKLCVSSVKLMIVWYLWEWRHTTELRQPQQTIS